MNIKTGISSIEELALDCAELKIKIALYQEQYDEKKVLLEEAISKTGESKYETELGSFRLQPKTTYTFSERYEKAKEDLDALKQEEINQGVAEKKTSYSLVFNQIKM